MTRKEIERQVLQLPPQERARLAQHILTSLEKSPQENYENLWIEEAKKRYQDFNNGNLKVIPADEVFREISARL